MFDCSSVKPESSLLALELESVRQLLLDRGIGGENLSIAASRGTLTIWCSSRDFLAIGDLWKDIDRVTEERYVRILVKPDRGTPSKIPLGLPI